MKKILLFLFLCSASVNAASADSIPNSGFEVWFTSTWFEFPGQWVTNNSQIMPPTVVRDSLPHSGLFAMKLTNQGALQPHASTEFAITTTHSDVGCYVRPALANNDSARIEVRFYYQSQLVDSGFAVIYNGIVAGYSAIIIPITQSSALVDTCRISIYGGTVPQSDIVFDDIQFDFLSGVNEPQQARLTLYPNPARDFIHIGNGSKQFNNPQIEAYNAKGQRVILHNLAKKSNRLEFDIQSISPGIWMIYLKDDENNYSAVFIKE
jgi:hypothetical protein